MLLVIVYLLGFGATLYITHKREDINNHEDIGIQCLVWPVFLVAALLILVLSIPEYISKLVKRLVR